MNIKGTVIYGEPIRSSYSKELEIIPLEKSKKNPDYLTNIKGILDDRFNKIKNTYNYIKLGINIYNFS